ncbi:ArsR/SmtB family transcription factor [Mycolicibacterium palauense]|uniref:ArsR/SmtB family transcription factor n=1 Tax=Mycolicibacterium palauense TaxID=2034511 RepID=UPI000BFEAABA|nr:metalloregulator ArsR/SmtB family transcription factor [Mycolicibacterium palauense]
MHTSISGFEMPTEAQVNDAVESFRMLSDPTRIKILWALLQGESSVACLADLAEVASAVVSQHLAKMRLAGLVKGRRQGTFVYYSAADQTVLQVLCQALLGDDTVNEQPGSPTAGRAEANQS